MLSTSQGSGKGERVELNYYWQKKLFILAVVGESSPGKSFAY